MIDVNRLSEAFGLRMFCLAFGEICRSWGHLWPHKDIQFNMVGFGFRARVRGAIAVGVWHGVRMGYELHSVKKLGDPHAYRSIQICLSEFVGFTSLAAGEATFDVTNSLEIMRSLLRVTLMTPISVTSTPV